MSDYKESHAELVAIRKERVLREAGFTDPQDIANGIDRLEGETVGEIKTSLDRLIVDLRLDRKKVAVDPQTMGNGPRYRPGPKDLTEVGRQQYHRVKQKRKPNAGIVGYKYE